MQRPVALLAVLASLPVLAAVGPGERVAAAPAAGDDLCELATADRAHTRSRSCLTCHDGSIASGRMARAHEGGASHPVDVDYLACQARRPGLRPSGALPTEVVLVDGRVACTTCHDPRSTERGKPAVTMSRSALCFGCHDI